MGDWFKDWFSSDYYLSVYSGRNNIEADIFLNGILKYIPMNLGSKVLDAACGAGRHSIIMAQKKFNVAAFDFSIPLLKAAAEESKTFNLDIKYFNCDLRFVPLKVKFNLILNLFTSFGYFISDDENFSFINSSYKMLEENGYFVFDYFNSEYIRNNFITENEKTINGLKIMEKRSVSNNRIIKNISIEKDGVFNNFEESVRLYESAEILERFSKIGFKIINIFGSYDFTEFSLNNSERLIIIFQK